MGMNIMRTSLAGLFNLSSPDIPLPIIPLTNLLNGLVRASLFLERDS